jgi:hypothetical protein
MVYAYHLKHEVTIFAMYAMRYLIRLLRGAQSLLFAFLLVLAAVYRTAHIMAYNPCQGGGNGTQERQPYRVYGVGRFRKVGRKYERADK